MPERTWKDETCGTCLFACEEVGPCAAVRRRRCRRLPPQMVHMRGSQDGFAYPDVCGYPWVWPDDPACAEWKESPDG